MLLHNGWKNNKWRVIHDNENDTGIKVSTFPQSYNKDLNLAPPRFPRSKTVLFEANSSNNNSSIRISVIRGKKRREERKKKRGGRAVTAVIGNQGRVRVDRGQTRPSHGTTAFYSYVPRQSRPTIPRFDNRSFKLALHADRISKRVL